MTIVTDPKEIESLLAEKELRCCVDCSLAYYGSLFCPNCGEPCGKPIPDDWLSAFIKSKEKKEEYS